MVKNNKKQLNVFGIYKQKREKHGENYYGGG
jgi:hypothetical protein